jgi:hypothetical protein
MNPLGMRDFLAFKKDEMKAVPGLEEYPGNHNPIQG